MPPRPTSVTPSKIGFMSFGKVHGSFFCIFIQKSGKESGSPQKSFGTILGSMFPTVVLSLGQRTREPTNNTFLTRLPLPWKLFSQCSQAEGFIFSPRRWWEPGEGKLGHWGLSNTSSSSSTPFASQPH